MAVRTDATAVQAILLAGIENTNYDAESPSLVPFIRAASIMVDNLVTCATDKGLTVSSDTLTEIETWVAAHAYQMADQGYSEKTTERARGKFQGVTKMYLEGTKYGQMAMMLDTTGCLAEMSQAMFGSATWGGKTPEEQIDYEDRGGNYLT